MVDEHQVGELREPTGGNDQLGRGRAISHGVLSGGNLAGQQVGICRSSAAFDGRLGSRRLRKPAIYLFPVHDVPEGLHVVGPPGLVL